MSQTSKTRAVYTHLVDGEAFGVVHQKGDRVSRDVPQSKVDEWYQAGVVEKTTPVRASIESQEKKSDVGSDSSTGGAQADSTGASE